MPSANIKVSGTWHPISYIGIKVSNTWQSVISGWIKVSGSWSQFFSSVVPPGTPSSLSATTNLTDRVDLTFSGSSGATSYDIFWNTTVGGTPSGASSPDFPTVSSVYSDTTIASGGIRYYWVRGKNGAGVSDWYPAVNGVYGSRPYPSYTVTFYGNGNTGGSTAAQTTNTATALTSNGFTRTGYTFNNWNTASNGSGQGYANNEVYGFGAALNLYAQWTIISYTVTFNGNGATGGSTAAQTASTTTALTANGFTRTSYTFNKWNTASNGSGTDYANGANYAFNASITLYALWTAVSYTVTFYGNNNTGGSTAAQTSSVAANLTANGFTRTGYTFNVWNTASNGSGQGYANQENYAFTANLSLYALWTVLAPSGGDVTLSPSGTQPAGTTLTAATQNWTGSPTSYNLRIYVDITDPPDTSDSTKATSSSSSVQYAISDFDAGYPAYYFKAFTTATNAGGTSSEVGSNVVFSGTAPSTPAGLNNAFSAGPTWTGSWNASTGSTTRTYYWTLRQSQSCGGAITATASGNTTGLNFSQGMSAGNGVWAYFTVYASNFYGTSGTATSACV